MKKSNISNLVLNVMFVILTAAAMFLIGVTFSVAKEEVHQVKAAQQQQH